MDTMYIVVASFRVGNDIWNTHDNYEDALADYNDLKGNPNTYSVSICAPLLSTDYSTPSDILHRL